MRFVGKFEELVSLSGENDTAVFFGGGTRPWGFF